MLPHSRDIEREADPNACKTSSIDLLVLLTILLQLVVFLQCIQLSNIKIQGLKIKTLMSADRCV